MRSLPRLWSSHTEAILYITLILFLIGAVNVFSASFVLAGQMLNDSYFFIKRQLSTFAVGFVLMMVVSRMDYHHIKRLTSSSVLVTVGLLIAVHFIGVDANGARRWINLGFKFQPSEFAKLTTILICARYLGPLVDRGRRATLFSWPVYVSVMLGALVLKQPDMGTAVIIVGLCIVLYIIAGLAIQQRYLLYSGGVGLLVYLTFAATYRAERIAAWLNPWAYQQTIGYQTVQSLLAIGSGGFFGVGLGMGASKFYYLPEAHTDFAFAVLCQEMGFIGALIVLILLALLGCCGGQIARQAPDGYGKMLAIASTILVLGQAVVNIAMVSGILPVVGVPLPFISYGGTSLIVNMIAIGILMSVGRRSVASNQPQKPEPVIYERHIKRQRLKLVRKP